jgi:periplasmic divalent cation tolerance protein
MSFVQVTTTTDSADSAAALARSAVETRLAACAQVTGPITSTYRWEGAIETAQEWTVTFKTVESRYAELQEHLKDQHSYDIPEIICTPIIAGDPAYLAWIEQQTTVRLSDHPRELASTKLMIRS